LTVGPVRLTDWPDREGGVLAASLELPAVSRRRGAVFACEGAATIALMAEIGIDRVRTRTIAERAGVNPALVHYHFGSVTALVLEAAEDALRRELGPSIDVLRSGATMNDEKGHPT